MNITHTATLVQNPNQRTEANVDQMTGMAWAPNGTKLAAVGKDKVIYLYDDVGQQRDRFPTRAVDPKRNAPYTVTSIVFSPDSTKLAVAQTDGIIFLYKIGNEFKLKKSITNKILQPFGVLKVLWPNEFEIICGLMDGKLRHTPVATAKVLRSRTFYNPDSQILALIKNPKGTLLASSHLDGRIGVFALGEADIPTLKYTIHSQLPVFALAFGGSMILGGTCDSRISVYDLGKLKQVLDFSNDELDRDFVSAIGSPSGLAVAFGGFDRIRLIRWVPRKKVWEEGPILDMKNLYTVTSLIWNPEGTVLVAGTMVGGLHYFETIIRKSKTERYEISYATPYHAIVTIKNPHTTAHIQSTYKLEILEVKILGQDRYAVGITLETMLICDLMKNLTSEIRWDDIDDNEKYYFENPNACMIFNGGEMTIVEYGQNKPLGTFRTEFINPHLISLRINERVQAKDLQGKQNKKLAYLIDLQTIAIIDLVFGSSLGNINHDAKIDWLELNETGTKLLFRDRKLRLYLVDVEKMEKNNLMHMCNFVQWVPMSDVIVAQNKVNLCIWYNVDSPGEFVEVDVRGLAFEIVRSQKESMILVQDGSIVHHVPLDGSRIEFGTALLDGDLLRALLYLELSDFSGEKQTMWKQLAKDAIDAKELKIAERACYAAGDIAKARFISTTIHEAEKAYHRNQNEISIVNDLQARISVLNGDLQTAEYIMLDNGSIENAIHLYTAYHRWTDAIRLGTDKHYNNLNGLVRAYFQYLTRTGQDEVAAEFFEDNGNAEMAAILFWSNGMPMKAARLIELNHNKIDTDPELLRRIGDALTERYLYGEAAEYYDAVGNMQKACELYKKSHSYEQAVRIAKKHFQGNVVELEEEWAHYLLSKKLYDAACNHFVEAGKLRQALDAAIQGRHWVKASNIIEAIEDPRTVATEFIKIGDHYAQMDDTINAEKCYMKAGNPKKAVDMYMAKGKWEEAYNLGSRMPSIQKDLESELLMRANLSVRNEKYSDAEKLYIALGQPDTAITMYGEARQFEDMLRLVTKYHPTHLNPSYQHVAEILRDEDNCKAAEVYFLKAKQLQMAVDMYIERSLFEDAVRICKTHGKPDSYKPVVYKWAMSLGADLGYKLLYRNELLDDCLLYYCENEDFDYALELANVMGRDKVAGVYYEKARWAEENEDLDTAVNCYINAEDYPGAIRLYMKHQDFEKAIRLAEESCPAELESVYVTYGEYLFEMESFSKFETVLLRADRVDVIIRLYQEKGMWNEALRICREYVPSFLSELQDAYDQSESQSSMLLNNRDASKIITRAQEYERFGQHDKAVEWYLKLSPNNTKDQNVLVNYWKRAADMAIKFMEHDEIVSIIKIVCPYFASIGQHKEAAGLCLDANMPEQGIEILMEGGYFDEAADMARDISPEIQHLVKIRHTQALKDSGNIDDLSSVNLEVALEMLMEAGQWTQLLEKAKSELTLYSFYLAKYAMKCIADKDNLSALRAYYMNGVPMVHSHANIVQSVVLAYLNEPLLDEFDNNIMARDLLFKYIKQLQGNHEVTPEQISDLERLLFICHLYTNRSVFRNSKGFEIICTKISIALLRYGDLIPIERSYFDAGISCKDVKWNNMALVFLNRYLDIFDAIEDGKSSTSSIDSSSLTGTDIPTFCTLPNFHTVSQDEHEEAKEWVLASSMDRTIFEELRRNEFGLYEGSTTNSNGETIYQPCIISGYPVISKNKAIAFESGKIGNKDDWNKFMTALKSGSSAEYSNIYKFITTWCGSNTSFGI